MRWDSDIISQIYNTTEFIFTVPVLSNQLPFFKNHGGSSHRLSKTNKKKKKDQQLHSQIMD